ncbi:energy transducer TonB [Winogradskyella aquimaris]|uniref:TonB protein C-terminal n=1 Tax=Winogradskyella aquimaris TaxID=864074 RepID=A0ABU5ERF7_9FLAO|nr:hypothetical protein [Winogradskyella aquimaris]MDY2588110.1 hypothetical protein [Winogradskyella aquimaris]
MTNRFKEKTFFVNQYTITISVILSALAALSCKKEPKVFPNTESDLIMKINAVQEQVMAQGNMTEAEEQALLSLCSIVSHEDGLAMYTTDDGMILKDVEITPVFDGCEDLSKQETRECFNNKVSTFIVREFNLSVSKDLNLSEPKMVEAFFIINENGNLTGMKVRDSEVIVQAEILRVLRKMPKMKPATHNGERVSVLCSIIVKYGNNLEVDVVYIPERPNT